MAIIFVWRVHYLLNSLKIKNQTCIDTYVVSISSTLHIFVKIYIFLWHHFPSAQRLFFYFDGSMDLQMMNSLTFFLCLKKILFYLYFWKVLFWGVYHCMLTVCFNILMILLQYHFVFIFKNKISIIFLYPPLSNFCLLVTAL